MNKFKNKKSVKFLVLFATILIALIISSIGIYDTYSALRDHDERANDMSPGDFETEIVDIFEDKTNWKPNESYDKKVSVHNTGETAGFVRVVIIPKLTAIDKINKSEVLLPCSFDSTVSDPLVKFNFPNGDWIDGKDGYYYYKNVIAPDERTTLLFDKVTIDGSKLGEEYDEAKLTVTVKSEGVNRTKYAYRDAWWNGKTPGLGDPLYDVEKALQTKVVE